MFVVETAGFNDNVWLDNAGRPATGSLHVTERFIRRDFGRMDIEVTIDDPKAYTRPWTVTQPLEYYADGELLEYICNENNKYFQLCRTRCRQEAGRTADVPGHDGPTSRAAGVNNALLLRRLDRLADLSRDAERHHDDPSALSGAAPCSLARRGTRR